MRRVKEASRKAAMAEVMKHDGTSLQEMQEMSPTLTGLVVYTHEENPV
jgi:hypothetical protein